MLKNWFGLANKSGPAGIDYSEKDVRALLEKYQSVIESSLDSRLILTHSGALLESNVGEEIRKVLLSDGKFDRILVTFAEIFLTV